MIMAIVVVVGDQVAHRISNKRLRQIVANPLAAARLSMIIRALG